MEILSSIDMTNDATIKKTLSVFLGMASISCQTHQHQPFDHFIAAENVAKLLQMPRSIADQVADAFVHVKHHKLLARVA